MTEQRLHELVHQAAYGAAPEAVPCEDACDCQRCARTEDVRRHALQTIVATYEEEHAELVELRGRYAALTSASLKLVSNSSTAGKGRT